MSFCQSYLLRVIFFYNVHWNCCSLLQLEKIMVCGIKHVSLSVLWIMEFLFQWKKCKVSKEAKRLKQLLSLLYMYSSPTRLVRFFFLFCFFSYFWMQFFVVFFDVFHPSPVIVILLSQSKIILSSEQNSFLYLHHAVIPFWHSIKQISTWFWYQSESKEQSMRHCYFTKCDLLSGVSRNKWYVFLVIANTGWMSVLTTKSSSKLIL